MALEEDGRLGDRFVRTHEFVGITREEGDKLIAILGRKGAALSFSLTSLSLPRPSFSLFITSPPPPPPLFQNSILFPLHSLSFLR
jgi:hypothetical protein